MQGTWNTIGRTVFFKAVFLSEGWVKWKSISKCKQKYNIPQMVLLTFGRLNKNNK
jgi:hypothetical protein